MFVMYDERPSDSPFVERVWRCRSGDSGEFLSVAATRVEVVITRVRSRTFLTVRGPETKPARLQYPGDAEWVGVRFTLGTFVPTLLPLHLRDRQDVDLPEAAANSFWLNGSVFEYPTFDQAESLVARLARQGHLLRDPNVERALQGRQPEMSRRSMQRHFLRATGLTVKALRHIDRARQAAALLKNGASILDVVGLAGYYDQAHLTRSLKYRIGQTPAQIQRAHTTLSLDLDGARRPDPAYAQVSIA
jgi:AraC-like DNA-binding protein